MAPSSARSSGVASASSASDWSLGAGVGMHHHAAGAVGRRHTAHCAHRRVGAPIGDGAEQALDVVARAAAHGVPARPVVQLQQAVVVAEADHRADRKAQHLVGRA
jgi:hypothetical protein